MILTSVKKGFYVGLATTWKFGKIIFPVTLIVSILKHTPILPWVIDLIAPMMGFLGLSGDAAIPLVLGNFLNLYASIGAILSLDLTVKEVFTIAVMLSFSHNMLIETSVALTVGVRLWVVFAVRFGLALLSGLFINLIWHGGNELANYGFASVNSDTVSGFGAVMFDGFKTAGMGIVQLALIVIPLMIVIQIFKDLHWLAVFSKWFAPVTRRLGMKENTSTALAAGLLLGLAYGAGVVVQAVKEDGVSKKDITLAFVFLMACHAVIEDTLIFMPLGIPVLPLLFIRLGTAIILTLVVSTILKRAELAKGKEAVIYEQ